MRVDTDDPKYRRRQDQEYEANRYAQLKHSKEVARAWRLRPGDEEARNHWIKYLESIIVFYWNEMFVKADDTLSLYERIFCCMLLEEDVHRLRELARECSLDGGFYLGRVIDVDDCYDVLELMLVHDVSFQMVEVLLTEGCARPDRVSARVTCSPRLYLY